MVIPPLSDSVVPRLFGPARHADDTRLRFVADIVARVPLARLIEIHLFSPIRQGGTETGVAVVVARREPDPVEAATAPNVSEQQPTAEAPVAAGGETVPWRHTIFTARYRLALRGADRGRWVVDVVEEADAPLITVAAVVRGVQRRAGDEAPPDRLDRDAVAHALG